MPPRRISRIKRIGLLFFILAVFFIAGNIRPEPDIPGQGSLMLMVPSLSAAHLPLILAVDQLNEDSVQGEAIQLVSGPGSDQVIQSMVRGEADLGLVPLITAARALEQGFNGVIIARETGADQVLVGRKNHPAGGEGPIVLDSRYSSGWQWWQQYSGFQEITAPISFDDRPGKRLQAVDQGKAEACTLSWEEWLVEDRTKFQLQADQTELQGGLVNYVILAPRSLLSSRKEILASLAENLAQIEPLVNSPSQELVTRAAAKSKDQKRDQIEKIIEAYQERELWKSLGPIDPAQGQEAWDNLKKLKVVTRPSPTPWLWQPNQ